MATDQLRLEYDRATALIDGLTDIRFKLLALVPTLSGTAVGLLRTGESAVPRRAGAIPGPAATIGVLVSELGNTQTRKGLRARILELERHLLGRELEDA